MIQKDQLISSQGHRKCHQEKSHLEVRPWRLFGRPAIKEMQGDEDCQIVRVIRQQVPGGWNGVPIAGNVDLKFYVLITVTRHVLWKEGKKEDVCGRWGARKIQIVIRWLGTGPVVKFAGQVLKFVWLKVKFG